MKLGTSRSNSKFYLVRSTKVYEHDPSYGNYLYTNYLSEDKDVKAVKAKLFPNLSKDPKVRERETSYILTRVYLKLPLQTSDTLEELVNGHQLEMSDVETDEENSFAPVKNAENLLHDEEYNEIRNLSVQAPVNKTNTVNTSNVGYTVEESKRIVPKKVVPIWKTHADKQLNLQYLYNYINQLERLAAKKMFLTENMLIESSLTSSDMTNVIENSPPEALETVEGLKKHLLRRYAPSDDEKRSMLHNIRQRAGESTHDFIFRVLLFYRMIKTTLSSLSLTELEKTGNETMWQDIKSLILNGIANATLKMQLKLRRDNLEPSNLLDVISTTESAIPEIKRVMKIEAETSAQSAQDVQIDRLVAAIKSHKNFRYERKKPLDESKKCSHCTKIGHLKDDCWKLHKDKAPKWFVNRRRKKPENK